MPQRCCRMPCNCLFVATCYTVAICCRMPCSCYLLPLRWLPHIAQLLFVATEVVATCCTVAICCRMLCSCLFVATEVVAACHTVTICCCMLCSCLCVAIEVLPHAVQLLFAAACHAVAYLLQPVSTAHHTSIILRVFLLTYRYWWA